MTRKDEKTKSLEGFPFFPNPPRSLKETGLNLGFLSDLVLKTLYFEGFMTGSQIAEALSLPFSGVVDKVLEFLRRERLCEVRGSKSVSERDFEYVITEKGSEKAKEVLERSQYVGPAPVPLEDYRKAIKAQALSRNPISPGKLRKALSHLVLGEDVLSKLGPGVNMGRSIFLYGPPGNGKTAISEAIGKLIMEDTMFIPYAVEVNGHVIKVYDNLNHKLVVQEAETLIQYDRRWLLIHRPFLTAGGELTMEDLDLIYNEITKYYEAPLQMKANGGMLLIDDFGRQQARPQDILNRWIVPLEKRVDYLTMHTGLKIEIPFEVLIVFSTNLPPHRLADEAFLRRIRHKIEVRNPTFEEYRLIFKRECERRGIPYDEKVLIYLLKEHYIKNKIPLRACHPRDLLDEIESIARYSNTSPRLTREMIDKAWSSYYLSISRR
ncbi:MAG: ATP-binding protein [Chloroflexi bacterium]|nr:MAG: ATP-binding protein [Chloroflexota bacterium]HDN80530.1 ATP-binding protein [Chloroflexota bacterium]